MARNAPGRHERSGITLMELMRRFPDDETAEKWFISIRWGDDIRCVKYDSDNVQTGAKHPTMPFRCRACRKFFSVKTGTVMQSSKLGYQVWAIAIYILTTGIKGTSSMKLHRDLGITQKTAWHLAHRIRKVWDTEGSKQFEGAVEVDETYIGGKEANKHKSKKLNAGRGTVGKIAVAGIKDRDTNQVSAEVVQSTNKATLQGFIGENVQQGSEVYTDEHGAYTGMVDYQHYAVAHGIGEYVRERVHTNGIESFWALMKRGYYGTYHQMSPYHLHRYLGRCYDQGVPVTDAVEPVYVGRTKDQSKVYLDHRQHAEDAQDFLRFLGSQRLRYAGSHYREELPEHLRGQHGSLVGDAAP